MGQYWAEIADKNDTERQVNFLKLALPKNGWVLDAACGTGRHSTRLAKDGYFMVGVDVSRALLAIAKKEGNFEVVLGDLRWLPFRAESFAGALSMDNSFGYQPTEKMDFLGLTETSRVLKKGGLFVLDVFNGPQLAVKYNGLSYRLALAFKSNLLSYLSKQKNWLAKHVLVNFFSWKNYPSFLLHQNRSTTEKGRRLCDQWVLYDKNKGTFISFQHTVRLYNVALLQDLLTKAGFMVDRLFGDYEKQPYDAKAKRLIFVTTHH
jgi:ubiquinone/menaquinone biosynthesis C-methylase UbiE